MTALYRLVERCGYGALTREIIRDRIAGIRDPKLVEELQLDAELTVATHGDKQSLQSEAVKQQQISSSQRARVDSQLPVQLDRVQRKPATGYQATKLPVR